MTKTKTWRQVIDAELNDVWDYCRRERRIFNGCTIAVLRERFGDCRATDDGFEVPA